MENLPVVRRFDDGTKMWNETYESFYVKTYIPKTDKPVDIINYGFVAPYLMIFEESRMDELSAKRFADENGLSSIASRFGGSVTFFYPTNEGGWEFAPDNIYENIISQSKIGQYYQDGVTQFYDRFTKKMGACFIRGGIPHTYVYGYGTSADYIAKNCFKTVIGDGLFGKGDITPACLILSGLGIMPKPERKDIPVLSIDNDDKINSVLSSYLDHFMAKAVADYEKDFDGYIGTFRRMVGYLDREPNFAWMKMVVKPDFVTVKTSPDNLGDDKGTTEHKVGYVAFYNKGIGSGEKAPLLLCFHGGGDSAFFMSLISRWYQVAYEHNFLLVCIENHLNSTATEMMELIEHLKGKFNIDTEKIYASGFSMGGCKSWDMYQEYPTVFAGLAPMDATFDVGLNSYGVPAPAMNDDVMVPIFYVGGEITPLPELPFQEPKCRNRMAHVLKVNKATKEYNVTFEDKDNWPDKIWGISGDRVETDFDSERNATLTMNLFDSEDGNCYTVFASVSGQGHECRHHSCENAWKFISRFSRKADGTITID